MATTIANLRIQLSASLKGLIRPFRKAKTEVKGFNKTVKSSGTSIKAMAMKLGGAVAALAAVRAGVNALKASFTELDQIGKFSDRIGASTEALQKMRFAGKLSGVSVQTMDMALQRWTKNTAKAAAGATELSKILENDLKLSVEDLIKLPLDKQMELFADALGKIPVQADRVRVAAALLDSEGVALIQTLQGGSEELKALFKEAEAAGIFTDTDIAKIEEANNAMAKVGQTWSYFKGQIAVGLAPLLTGIADGLREIGVTGENAGWLIKTAFDAVAESFTLGRIGLLELQQTFAELIGDASLLDETNAELRKQEEILKDIGKEEKKQRRENVGPVSDPSAAFASSAAVRPAAMIEGSLAAFSQIHGAARQNTQKEMADAAKKQAEEAAKANDKLTSIDRKMPYIGAAVLA